MAPTDRDNLSFEDDPAPAPELDALAECLRSEASELSAMYPPGSADRVPLERLAPTPVPRRGLIWSVGATVAILAVCATIWTTLRPDRAPQVTDPNPHHSVQVVTPSIDDVHTPQVESPVPDIRGVLPSSQIGVHDMNGPEIEAVLILLEDNKTSLKLAL